MEFDHSRDVAAGRRFAFGANWRQFLGAIDERRIGLAEQSLKQLLCTEDLSGAGFFDVGSGSGLFSLAARRLGAVVTSFDFDPESVASTLALRKRYRPDDPNWTVQTGSILDAAYLDTLGQSRVVYSWGVLHHTGSMWAALGNIDRLVASDGYLILALYNDQGRMSLIWLSIKRFYNKLPQALRWLVLGPALVRLWGPTCVRDLLLGKPFRSWRNYADDSIRGMSPWHDLIDWVGGLPFEVAKPGDLLEFYRSRGFELIRLRTCAGGIGCNEYVFRKLAPADAEGPSHTG
jgi:SAM-dependent methyltransferase